MFFVDSPAPADMVGKKEVGGCPQRVIAHRCVTTWLPLFGVGYSHFCLKNTDLETV